MNDANFRVLDTNVVSYLLAGGNGAKPFRPILSGSIGAVSFVTVGELIKGALLSKWGPPRMLALREHIRANYVVLPYTIRVAEEWAALMAACVAKGKTPGLNDAWIAATALAYECPVVTNDGGYKTMQAHHPRLIVLP